ncbi:MAG: Nif3-like dinuclear metal center hexameric protein [Moorellales bacterium]
MGYTCRDVIQVLEEWAPPELAESGDNVGLATGRPDQPVDRVVVALEANAFALEEASRVGAQMLVVHHPLIPEPLTSLRWDLPGPALVAEAVRRNLAVYVLHTNWDKAPGGVSYCLAEVLGLEEVEPLEPARGRFYYKLVTFVPEGYEDRVREALAQAGAGRIGAYSHCSFEVEGTGTFLPLEGANPFLGRPGNLERARERRLEMLVPRRRLGEALRALLSAHPYEEVAYDVYPLDNAPSGSGLGVLGRLPSARRLQEFCVQVKQALGAPMVRLAGDPQRVVSRVAVCGGSGGSLIPAAVRRGAEVLVTGEVKYHRALAALASGMAVIEAGHAATERVGLPRLAERLQKALPDLQVQWLAADGDPWRHY